MSRDCGCAIALRVQSTLAASAVAELMKLSEETASRCIAEAEEHAKRLRAECDAGNHGPHEKRRRP